VAATGSLTTVVLLALALITRLASRPTTPETRRASAIDLVLATYLVGFALVYLLVAFNAYPRYAHTLAPIASLLIARTVQDALDRVSPGTLRTAGTLLAAGVLISGGASALEARTGASWLNESRRAHVGIEETAAYLNTLPPGTIVYDHWAGWLLGWYTGQDRPPDMWLRIVYYPTPEALSAGALSQPDPMPRYFVVPQSSPAAPWLSALRSAGFGPSRAAVFGRYAVYRLLPP
jgi:hypothetical protein